MIQVQITNAKSDYAGKVGKVSKAEWQSEKFWLTFCYDGNKQMLMARSSLVQL